MNMWVAPRISLPKLAVSSKKKTNFVCAARGAPWRPPDRAARTPGVPGHHRDAPGSRGGPGHLHMVPASMGCAAHRWAAPLIAWSRVDGLPAGVRPALLAHAMGGASHRRGDHVEVPWSSARAGGVPVVPRDARGACGAIRGRQGAPRAAQTKFVFFFARNHQFQAQEATRSAAPPTSPETTTPPAPR